MRTHDFDIGVIGGGAAGLTVTAGAARLGAKTILIEKEGVLGGDCLHFGCVPSKTLIHIARIYHQTKRTAVFGLPEMGPPPVDYRRVAERIRSVIRTIQEHDSEERFCSLGAKVAFGVPQFRDEHAVDVDGVLYSARTWVVATGSSPSVPPVEGLEKTPFLTNREIFSLDALPRSMIILGAGPVAIEMAQAFSRLGTEVIVVQRSGQILGREDPDMAHGLMEILRGEGMTFHLHASVLRVRSEGGIQKVLIRTGDGPPSELHAEKILVAMGREANVSGLGLEGIGVEFDHRGIRVDARLRTTQKAIYAAGDVTGAYQFTHAAGYEGGIVLSNAVFRIPRKTDYTLLPWCTYTDPELASIGMNETRAGKAGIRYSVWTETFKNNDRGLAQGESVGRIKLILDEKERPIGVQILGPNAGEILNEWVAVLNGKTRLSTLASAVHPYPTLGEINKRVAGEFLSSKLFSETVKKGLRLFFSLKGRACERTEGGA
jgi:pyruvate/2-oxoglutarate dehydrogenase complex dihydrolipoamide dehydrogenase (E3) component